MPAKPPNNLDISNQFMRDFHFFRLNVVIDSNTFDTIIVDKAKTLSLDMVNVKIIGTVSVKNTYISVKSFTRFIGLILDNIAIKKNL